MGKYDGAIVLGTIIGSLSLFGTMAYLKGRRSVVNNEKDEAKQE